MSNTQALGITELVLRDGHQSLFATRGRTEDMIPVAELMDQVGFWAVETWGGATFDACIRFLGEDPWERLRALREAMPNTRMQMLFRAQNILGYATRNDKVGDGLTILTPEVSLTSEGLPVELELFGSAEIGRYWDETSEDFDATFAMMPYDPAGPSGEIPVVDPEKLLITQVCTKDTGAEFIEIHNPTGGTVDLSYYYLTDAINYNFSTQLYWYITQGDPAQDTIGGGHYNDFHARFPDGASIAPGEYQTVAIAGSEHFFSTWGILPTYELYEDGASPDAIRHRRPPPIEDPPWWTKCELPLGWQWSAPGRHGDSAMGR